VLAVTPIDEEHVVGVDVAHRRGETRSQGRPLLDRPTADRLLKEAVAGDGRLVPEPPRDRTPDGGDVLLHLRVLPDAVVVRPLAVRDELRAFDPRELKDEQQVVLARESKVGVDPGPEGLSSFGRSLLADERSVREGERDHVQTDPREFVVVGRARRGAIEAEHQPAEPHLLAPANEPTAVRAQELRHL
jgi:hypothetical protein